MRCDVGLGFGWPRQLVVALAEGMGGESLGAADSTLVDKVSLLCRRVVVVNLFSVRHNGVVNQPTIPRSPSPAPASGGGRRIRRKRSAPTGRSRACRR